VSTCPAGAATQQLAATSTAVADYPTSHEQIHEVISIHNFLDKKFVPSQASTWIDLHDPATNNLVTRAPQSTDAELKAAVESA
jgi:malonate-semialdehyde dehydrogenase (acetylating) / methylmalonate-semialdehyde dehydrogenase